MSLNVPSAQIQQTYKYMAGQKRKNYKSSIDEVFAATRQKEHRLSIRVYLQYGLPKPS